MIAALGGSKGVAASAARLAFCSAGSFLQQPVVDDRVIERRIRDSSFRIEGAVLTHPTLHQNESTIFDSEQLLCVAVCLCCVGLCVIRAFGFSTGRSCVGAQTDAVSSLLLTRQAQPTR